MKCDVHWCNALSTGNSRWCAVHQDEYEQQGPDLQRAEGPYPLDISFAILKQGWGAAITGGLSPLYDKAKQFGERMDNAAMGMVPSSQVREGDPKYTGGTKQSWGDSIMEVGNEIQDTAREAFVNPVQQVIGEPGDPLAEEGMVDAGTGLRGKLGRFREKVGHKLLGEKDTRKKTGILKPLWSANVVTDKNTKQKYKESPYAPRFARRQQLAVAEQNNPGSVDPQKIKDYEETRMM